MPASLRGKALFSVLCVLVAFGIVQAQNGTNATCIRDYFDLEKSLLSSKPNIDSLTKTWFPPNEQSVSVVEAFYYINDSDLVEHPLILELGGLNATELQQRADYRYRWSLTPIYLFMDPQVLESLSLRVIRILRHEARLVVDPICENYTVKGIRLPEYHLNQMTSLLRSYATMRSDSLTQGIVDQSQGYASYFNYSRDDFFVLEFDDDYQGNMHLLVSSLIALAVFVTLAIPLLIYAHYKTMYNLAQDEDSAYVFIIWGNATVCMMTVTLVLVVDIVFVTGKLIDGPPSLWQYILCLALVTVLILFDLVLAVAVPKQRDFPVPRLLNILCCHGHVGCHGNTIFLQTVAIWFVVMAVQLISFHACFIFLAFIASPVQAASTALLYVAAIFCGISLVTLFFAVFQKGPHESHQKTLRFAFQRLIYLILFLCILAFVILFSTCFLRVTIYVGDFESGGLPALFASIAPSILLGALGVLAKRVLQKYNLKKGSEIASEDTVEEGAIGTTSSLQSMSTSSDANEDTSALTLQSHGAQGTRKRPSTAIEMHGTATL